MRAALGGWYTAEASAMQRRLGDGESVALNISFSKGAGTKSQLTVRKEWASKPMFRWHVLRCARLAWHTDVQVSSRVSS